MDVITLARTMRRLAAWLDRACQPADFVQKQYDRAPFGRSYVSIAPARQQRQASANWNRVHLCGTEPGLEPEALTQFIELFTSAGVMRFFVWLSPGPDMDIVRGWLAQAGFEPRMQWTRYPTLVRESLDPAPFRTDLLVREADRSEIATARATLGAAMWDEYERSFGQAGFSHFMAFDGVRPVATGALAVFEGIGYLTAAATAEGDRGRGAQSALIAARIAKARDLGCTMLAVDTLTMLEHSLRNLERAGFRVAYEKEVYEWSAEPQSA